MNKKSIDIYIDFKSPYAYLSIAPSIVFAEKNKLIINWLPYILEIPDYLGSAEVDNNGNIIKSERNAHQWRRVKYSYMDCRRYANLRNMTVRGPQKIWNTQLISIGLLWIKRNYSEFTITFINHVFEQFWNRKLDLESYEEICKVYEDIGINSNSFKEWAIDEGKKELDLIMNQAHENGVFGVPSYFIENELFWGREQLPLIEARLTNNYSNLI